jgi:hypothetical protein
VRETKAPRTVVRSVRVTPPSWDRARARAESDGTSVTAVLRDLLEGYGLGKIDPPRVETRMIFTVPR